MIRTCVLLAIKQTQNESFVPAAISNRHVHLNQKMVDALFGAGYILKKQKDLSQPGQYACQEFVTLEGPKGTLKLRVLGPVRRETQVELSVTDARNVGIAPVARLSGGDLPGTPGAVLAGPAGRVELEHGVIVAMRHLHMSTGQAVIYGLTDGDTVRLLAEGPRGGVLDNVVVRAGNGHELELHIDFDEANCAMIGNGDLLKIIGHNAPAHVQSAGGTPVFPTAPYIGVQSDGQLEAEDGTNSRRLTFVTERDVLPLSRCGELVCARNAIITPLARDRINQNNIRIRTE